ncbi:hypothetical protein JHK85_026799 [Glycine max]|nr:hypothetical protein JHK85_026799 [Glycine max]
MSIFDGAFMNTQLSKHTSIFGLRLWVVIGILIGVFIVFTLFLLSLCLVSRRNRRRSVAVPGYKVTGDADAAKDIHTIVHLPGPHMLRPVAPEIHVEMGKKTEHRVVVQCDGVSSEESKVTVGSGCETTSSFGSGSVGGLGLGGQAEKEFKIEVEAIGRVRHKNLVRLLGYCVEGAYRMLVYEYVDNGNLEQWLHGDVGAVSPLTWNIRMNIILGTARGLAYLHEGLEPKVVHRDVKSSNILIDRQWNSKVSDFGLAKLLCSENSYVTTRVMGTFGYVAPEYACTGMLTEKSDIYSFGILIMEIITGRSPVDYSRPQGEVNLIEWLKTMVGNRKSEEVVDPKLPEMPFSKALKRALLIALRCVDPDATKRPKMGHVIHMLEADDLLFHTEQRTEGESSRSYQSEHKDSNLDKRTGGGVIDKSEDASTRWR